jgi:GNAT superfamily N-acetyltransferase
MWQIEVRSARIEDRDIVLAFCSDTWEWGDYIEHVWDDWLHDPDGRLFVVTLDKRPVGISHMHVLSATEVWLEGLRIDPKFRRAGLASALIRAMLLEAMQRGATLVRLMVEAENTPAIRFFEYERMRRVGGCALYTASPLINLSKKHSAQKAFEQGRIELATPDNLNEIINYLNASNVFPATGGLYYVDYTAYSITTELLETYIADQHIYLLRRWDRLDGLAIAEPRDGHKGTCLSLGYIDGTSIEAVGFIAYNLRFRLPKLALDTVLAYVPDLVLMRDVLNGMGYKSNGSAYYTYERVLGGQP